MPATDFDLVEFVEKIVEMRAAQDQFHRTKLWSKRQVSMKLEAEVDEMCSRIVPGKKYLF